MCPVLRQHGSCPRSYPSDTRHLVIPRSPDRRSTSPRGAHQSRVACAPFCFYAFLPPRKSRVERWRTVLRKSLYCYVLLCQTWRGQSTTPQQAARYVVRRARRDSFLNPAQSFSIYLSDSEFGGGNALVSRLRRDPISASKCDFDFWRRRRDSNSRGPFDPAAFPRRCTRPLCDASLYKLSTDNAQLTTNTAQGEAQLLTAEEALDPVLHGWVRGEEAFNPRKSALLWLAKRLIYE